MPPKLRSAIRGDDDPMSREVDQSNEGVILAPTEILVRWEVAL